MSTAIRLVCVFCAALSLTGCAPMLAMLGSNTSFVALATQVERIKLAADGASLVRWDKTLTDYALSQATGKECRIFNILAIESVCVEKTPVIAADSDALPKEVATGAAPADPAALPTEVATATPADSDALPKEIAASVAPADSDALPKVVAAAVTPEKSVALPKEIAASVAPAESHTHATIAPARSFEFSREQASGD
jgi:hypothetical protein